MADPRSNLGEAIDACMLVDRHRFRQRWRRLRGDGRGRGRAGGRGRADTLERLEADVAASRERRARRRGQRPAVTWPDDLPIVERRDEIAAAIAAHPVVVVCGETGSGKSTQLPKLCLDLGRGDAGLIGMTQPRRIAARSIAERVAEELGTTVGGAVGYKVRFGDCTGPDAIVKILTDGMLLAETQRDRRLEQYDTIIIDEAHERSLNIDFLLGYVQRLLPRRPDLKVVITSATIDPRRFSDHFGGAPVIEVSGRTHPVDVRYRPLDGGDDEDAPERDVTAAILDAVDEVAEDAPGDVLVFLPGEREIRETAEALRKHHPPQTEILPLYARLSSAEQHRVFEAHAARRIVLATNVAETSLTVPGIRAVVDPGAARISRYSPRSKVQRLVIEPISQASAKQRAGRCGRLGPGVCVRLYAERDHDARPAFTDPEILRTNLASVVLQMAALDLGDIRDFPFIDPPRRAMIRDAVQTLREIGALDERERLTPIGRRIAELPVDPRLGRMLLAAIDEQCLAEMLVIVAGLSVQDPRERPHDRRDAADQAHRALADDESEFLSWLKLWEFYHEQRRHLSWNKLRRECRARFLSFMRLREWEDVHRQLHAQLTQRGQRLNDEPASYEAIHRAILAGLLGNVGRRGDGKAFDGTRGSTFHVFPGSVLFSKPPTWAVAAEIVETTRRYARCVARVQPAWIEAAGAHLLKRTHTEPAWDRDRGQVMAFERVTVLGLEVVARRRVPYGRIDPAEARAIFIHHALVEGDLETSAPFLERNRALVDELEAIEAKRRRRDVLVDLERRAAFYDARLPADVWSARAFHRWLREATKRDPDVLVMRRDDLVAPDAPDVDPDLFPDEMVMGSLRLPLTYDLDPGGATDGVTVVVPAAALDQVSDRRLEWGVPGQLEERIVALLRSLPKDLRRSFVPAPDWAKACADRLEFGRGALLPALADVLRELGGVDVPVSAFDERALPEHLRLRVRVEDGTGGALAEGRELDPLRADVRPAVTEAFADVARESFDRSGLVRWDFGDLEERVTVERDGLRLEGYPTLEDEGASVGIRLASTRAEAEVGLRLGARRLVALEAGDDLRVQVRHVPGLDDGLRLAYAPFSGTMTLDELVALRIAERIATADGAPCRAEAEFRRRVDAGVPDAWRLGGDVVALLRDVLDAHRAATTRLEETTNPIFEPAVREARAHLDELAAPGFLATAPLDRLEHFPRYFRAIEKRLERLPGGGHRRDAVKAAELEPWSTALRARRRLDAERGRREPAVDAFRWMLEEYRVALFAQELGTAQPISPKRIAAAWRRVESS